jgi:hypothetical protein
VAAAQGVRLTIGIEDFDPVAAVAVFIGYAAGVSGEEFRNEGGRGSGVQGCGAGQSQQKQQGWSVAIHLYSEL